MQQSQSAAFITFNVSGVLTLTAPLEIANINGRPITIDGSRQTVTLDGGNQYNVLRVAAGANLTLNALTIQRGNDIANRGHGGGIVNGGRLTINHSSISDNNATVGGGLVNEAGATLTINDSQLTGNQAVVGGALQNQGTLFVNRSTLSDNKSTEGGGFENESVATISNSIITGNRATNGSAGSSRGQLTISNSTITGNVGSVGGIMNADSGTLNLLSTILTANPLSDLPNRRSERDVAGLVHSLGYNLIGTPMDDKSTFVPLDQVGITAAFVGSNAGLNQIMALTANSSAVGKGFCGGDSTIIPSAPPVEVDQRNIARKFIGLGCDIGALEVTTAHGLLVPPPILIPATPGSNGDSVIVPGGNAIGD